MSLYYANLDDRTRQLMLEEVEYDISHNQLHISPFLSGQGQRDYINLLREAIRSGNDQTLAEQLRSHRRITRTLPRRKPKGGFTIAAKTSREEREKYKNEETAAHPSGVVCKA